MKPDDFENTLARVPLRRPPPDWRDAILATARDAALPSRSARTNHPPSLRGILENWLHRLATPWPALAATAACSLLLNGAAQLFSPHPGTPPQAVSWQPGQSFAEVLRQHRSEVLALVNSEEPELESASPTPAPNPPASNKPRSQNRPADPRHPAQPAPSPA
jgi:hypothetical protein